MNGLDVIHSQNEAATIQANTQTVLTALQAGHSAIVYLDEFGTHDYTIAPTVFPTQFALDDYIRGHVPLHLQSRLQIHRGRVLAAEPTPAPAPAPVALQPSGHQANGSGLQNHSVGGIYPYIVIYRPFTRTFDVSHADAVTRSEGHTSYDAAYADAQRLQAA